MKSMSLSSFGGHDANTDTQQFQSPQDIKICE